MSFEPSKQATFYLGNSPPQEDAHFKSASRKKSYEDLFHLLECYEIAIEMVEQKLSDNGEGEDEGATAFGEWATLQAGYTARTKISPKQTARLFLSKEEMRDRGWKWDGDNANTLKDKYTHDGDDARSKICGLFDIRDAR